MADPTVSDRDFRNILDATRDFVRSVVMPRELEITTENRVPDDIRDQTREMGPGLPTRRWRTPPPPPRAARRSASSNWCRRCSPTCRPG